MPSGNFKQKDGYPSNNGSHYRRVKDCIIQQVTLCEKSGEYDIAGMKCKTDSGGLSKVLQTQGKLNGITNLFQFVLRESSYNRSNFSF